MSSSNITPQQLRLFAVLLAMPNEESLAVLEEITNENNWLNDSVSELKEMPLELWQAEHTRLFMSGRPTCCPPYESVYINGIMNGPVCGELEQFYKSIGLESVEDVPSDYLGVMLECAAYLLEQSLSLQNGEETHFQTLWQNHLAKWVPQFANDLQENSEIRLYQQLGLKLKELF